MICAVQFDGDSNGVKRQVRLDKGRLVAQERGGRLLSAEIPNVSTKLLWECSIGHRWEAPLGDISNNGSWCPTCRHRVPSIDDMRRLAEKRGGKCLSDAYVNGKTPLQWRCVKHHTWWAAPNG